MEEADIGLAVTGKNLVLNRESKECTVAVYNSIRKKVDNTLQKRYTLL